MLNSDGQKNPGQNEDYKSATNVEFSLFHTNNSSFLNIYSHFGISLKVLLWNLDELVKFFHCMKKKLGYHYKRWKEAKVDGISSQKSISTVQFPFLMLIFWCLFSVFSPLPILMFTLQKIAKQWFIVNSLICYCGHLNLCEFLGNKWVSVKSRKMLILIFLGKFWWHQVKRI